MTDTDPLEGLPKPRDFSRADIPAQPASQVGEVSGTPVADVPPVDRANMSLGEREHYDKNLANELLAKIARDKQQAAGRREKELKEEARRIADMADAQRAEPDDRNLAGQAFKDAGEVALLIGKGIPEEVARAQVESRRTAQERSGNLIQRGRNFLRGLFLGYQVQLGSTATQADISQPQTETVQRSGAALIEPIVGGTSLEVPQGAGYKGQTKETPRDAKMFGLPAHGATTETNQQVGNTLLPPAQSSLPVQRIGADVAFPGSKPKQ